MNRIIQFIGTVLLLLVILAFAMAFCGCVVTETRTITTDKGGNITDTTSKTRRTDPAAWALAGDVASVYLPGRAVVVREEKAATPEDLKRVLKGRPITKEEIASRWRPAR